MNNNGRRFNNNRNNNNRRYNNNNRNSGSGSGGNNNNRRFSNSNIDDESANISPQQRRNFENKRDQYLMKAKDALSAGDKIEAETMFQYADHYFRMANLGLPPRQERQHSEHGHSHGQQNDGQIPDYVSNVPNDGQNSQSSVNDDISSLPFLKAEIPAPNDGV